MEMKSKKLIMTLCGLLGATIIGVQLLVSQGEEGTLSQVASKEKIEAVKEVTAEEGDDLPKEVEKEAETTSEKIENVEEENPSINTAEVASETAANARNSESIKVQEEKNDSKNQEIPKTEGSGSVPVPVPDTSIGGDNNNVASNYLGQVEQSIFNLVNEERSKAGLPLLTYNSTMEKYARIKSKDMGDNNYFSHEDLRGNLITTQMSADGVRYNSWAENIAYIGGAFNSADLANQFMNNWMNSSGHRANILSSDYTSIGIGVYKIGNKVYATQEFIR